MALSMDEEHILAEIEQHLVKSEPALAARLTSFGRSGVVNPLRSSRVRIVASCLALVTVTIVSLIVYALLPLRAMPDRGAGRASSAPRQPTMTAPQRGPVLKGMAGPSLVAPSP
jgi:Protein of unknown function (DUF3040)